MAGGRVPAVHYGQTSAPPGHLTWDARRRCARATTRRAMAVCPVVHVSASTLGDLRPETGRFSPRVRLSRTCVGRAICGDPKTTGGREGLTARRETGHMGR